MAVLPPPFPTNQTCDIYRNGRAPPAAPDVANVPCYLEDRYRNIKPLPAGGGNLKNYTHIMRVNASVDIRDGTEANGWDNIWVPQGNPTSVTEFSVTWVSRVGKGTSLDHKIVYLYRLVPAWPASNI
jgi:hypothetical protein